MELLAGLVSSLSVVSMLVCGLLALFGLVGVPRALVLWLADGLRESHLEPEIIVVLGGGGMPSESGLIRCYYAAIYARTWPQSLVVVALPGKRDSVDGAVQKMCDELALRGIARDRIEIECTGRNTFEQAIAIRELVGVSGLNKKIGLVSSLIHSRRAILCFKKVGFTQVFGLPASNVPLDADMGRGQFIRYRFWQNLGWSIGVSRELLAIATYKLRGQL